MVADIAAAVLIFYFLQKCLEHFHAGSVPGFADILAFKVGAVGMHYHPRIGVVDPEVVFTLRSIANVAEKINCLAFCLLLGQVIFLCKFVKISEGAHR